MAPFTLNPVYSTLEGGEYHAERDGHHRTLNSVEPVAVSRETATTPDEEESIDPISRAGPVHRHYLI